MSAAEVAEWLEKADRNRGLANVADPKEYPDEVCFLCQQAAEKYLKAILVTQGQTPPMIHDLIRLNDLIVAVDPRYAELYEALHVLDPYAVATRYPGWRASADEAEEARVAVDVVCRKVRELLGSEPASPLTDERDQCSES